MSGQGLEGSAKVNKGEVNEARSAEIKAFPTLTYISNTEAPAGGVAISSAVKVMRFVVCITYDKAAIRTSTTFYLGKYIPEITFTEIGEQGGEPHILRKLVCSDCFITQIYCQFDVTEGESDSEGVVLYIQFQVSATTYSTSSFETNLSKKGNTVSAYSNIKSDGEIVG